MKNKMVKFNMFNIHCIENSGSIMAEQPGESSRAVYHCRSRMKGVEPRTTPRGISRWGQDSPLEKFQAIRRHKGVFPRSRDVVRSMRHITMETDYTPYQNFRYSLRDAVRGGVKLSWRSRPTFPQVASISPPPRFFFFSVCSFALIHAAKVISFALSQVKHLGFFFFFIR